MSALVKFEPSLVGRRVKIVDSGGSNYFKPGQFGYIVSSTRHGGMHTLDAGNSRPGQLTHLVSKTKSMRGGALWFSEKGVRLSGRK